MFIEGGSSLSTTTLSFSSVTFTNCRENRTNTSYGAGNGIMASESTLTLFGSYGSWSDLITTTTHSSYYEIVYSGIVGTEIFSLLHMKYSVGNGSWNVVYVSSTGSDDISTCGWSDIPCLMMNKTFTDCECTLESSSLTYCTFTAVPTTFSSTYLFPLIIIPSFFLHRFFSLLIVFLFFGIHCLLINKRFRKTIYSSFRPPSIMPPTSSRQTDCGMCCAEPV